MFENLAYAYHENGDYFKATEVWELLYERYCTLFGKEDLKTLTVLHNLAHAYDNAGNYDQALCLNQKIYGFRCALLGENHPQTKTALENFAVIYLKNNNTEALKKIYSALSFDETDHDLKNG